MPSFHLVLGSRECTRIVLHCMSCTTVSPKVVCRSEWSSTQTLFANPASSLYLLLQAHYIYGDKAGGLYAASLFPKRSPQLYEVATYENGTARISPVRAFPEVVKKIKFKLAKLPSFPSDDVLYSWAIDNNKDVYRLSSTGIYRIANATDCKADCHAHPRKNVSPGNSTVTTCVVTPSAAPSRFNGFASSWLGLLGTVLALALALV